MTAGWIPTLPTPSVYPRSWTGCTQLPVKAEPSSAVHSAGFGDTGASAVPKHSFPLQLHSAKAAPQCQTALFQDGWKALRRTGTPCKSSALAPFQRQIEICLFAQAFLSHTHGYTRDSSFLGSTQMRGGSREIKQMWKEARSAEGLGAACFGAGSCACPVWGVCLLERALREPDTHSLQSRCVSAGAGEQQAAKGVSSGNFILH